MTRKDVTFAGLAMVAGGNDAGNNITNVDKIVSAAYASFETTSGSIDDELGEVAGFEIVGSDNARWMDDAGVKSAVLDGFEYVAGGFGFGFSVFALDFGRVKIGDFGNGVTMR